MLQSQKTRHAAFFTPDRCGDSLDTFIAKYGEAAWADRMKRKPKPKPQRIEDDMATAIFAAMKPGREYTITDIYWLAKQRGMDASVQMVRTRVLDLVRFGQVRRVATVGIEGTPGIYCKPEVAV